MADRERGGERFQPGEVYATCDRHRRIIGVLHGRVVYSIGGDNNRICKAASMQRWLQRTKAARLNKGGDEHSS